MAGGLIRAGGAFIELILSKTSAMQGLKEFEIRFRATLASLGRLGFGANLGAGMSTMVGRGLSSALRNVFSGNTFANYFFNAARSLTEHVKNFFSGSFFERLANGFRRAGQSLTFNGLLFSTILGSLSGLLTGPIKEFAKAEQQIGRFQSVFGSLSDEAAAFAEVLAKDVNQSVFELKDELSTFQAILQGSGFNPRQALDLSKMFVEATQDLLAFDDSITTAKEATDRLVAGLSGMVVPVQRFGADIRKASLEEELLEQGINETTASLTQQERVLLRTQKIFEALGRSGAIGQARREVNTLQAVLRGSGAAARTAAIALGEALAPAAQIVLRAFTAGARATEKWARENRLVVLGAGAAIVALTGLGGAFVTAGLAAFSMSAAMKALAVTMTAIAAPAVALAAAVKLIGVAVGGAVVVLQTGAAAISLLVTQLALMGQAVVGVGQLAVALAGLAKSIAMIVVGTVVSKILLLTRYLVNLGTVGARAVYVVGTSFAALGVQAAILTKHLFRLAISGFALLAASTAQAAVGLSIIFVRMLAITRIQLAATFQAIANAVRGTVVAFAQLTQILAVGFIQLLKTAGATLLSIGASALAAGAYIVSSFVSVLVPLAAVALALGAIATAVIALKPKVATFFQSILGAGGAAEQVFGRIKEAGRAAVQTLGDGFNLLKSDAKEAFSGIADALKAGDIILAAKILWTTLQMEFLTGWAKVVPIWQQFGLSLALIANDLWANVVSIFTRGYQEIALVGTALSQAFVAIFSAASGAVNGALSWLSSLFGGTTAEMEALWSSQENWVLQITDLLRDAFTVTSNYILGLWDDVTGAIEKAWITAKNLGANTTEAAQALKDIAAVDERNKVRAAGRQDEQDKAIIEREVERKRASKAIADERKRVQEEIEAKRLEREKQFREMFGAMDENANARLEAKVQEWDGLLDQAAKARDAENKKPPGESVLDGWRERIQALMEDAGFGGAGASPVGRRSEAAFADMARFGLGSTPVEEKQLRELIRLRKAAERNRPIGPARAGA